MMLIPFNVELRARPLGSFVFKPAPMCICALHVLVQLHVILV